MATQLVPYMFLSGRCIEALEFDKVVFARLRPVEGIALQPEPIWPAERGESGVVSFHNP